jgi:hypothetical protein
LHPVPANKVDRVKQIAAVAMTDPDVLGAYPLNEAQAAQIAGEINQPIQSKALRLVSPGLRGIRRPRPCPIKV